MTLYRGLDIGTAKPTAAERQQVPHHLIDVLEPEQEFTVADYLKTSVAICEEIVARGRTPLFVGGTGLYLRSLLRGVFQGPPADTDFRRHAEARCERDGPEALHAELAAVDAVTAARLHPNDIRRVIRAIEVYRLTGKPLSAQQAEGPQPVEERPPHVYWLDLPRDRLYARIDQRVKTMLANGWIDEAERLAQRTPAVGPTARQALGYQELFDWLDRGRIEPQAQVCDDIQARTRQFAKRQLTWFRNLPECHPITLSGRETPVEIAETIEKIASTSSQTLR